MQRYILYFMFLNSSHSPPNYAPIFDTLPKLLDLDKENVEPEEILESRLVKKGNNAVVQLCVRWTNLPTDAQTWEDETVLRAQFLDCRAWGQAPSSGAGTETVVPVATGMDEDVTGK
jgi:hypothetical protein